MQATNIGWTDFSSSPVKYRDKAGKVVWACVMASPGCQNCYSQSLATRWNKGKPFTATNIEGVGPFLDTEELKEIVKSKKITGKRVFIEDMSDLFGSWVPDEMIDQVFAAMALRPDVTFQVLTKRADRMAAYLDKNWMSNGGWHRCMVVGARCCAMKGESAANWGKYAHVTRNWPLRNVLIGFSAENQEWFDKRAVQAAPLMRAGWKVWTSFEPLLGRIDPTHVAVPVPPKTVTVRIVGDSMEKWHEDNGLPTKEEMPAPGMWPVTGHVSRMNLLNGQVATEMGLGFGGGPRLSWAVVGGESGRGHRACEVKWIADLAGWFDAAGVPIFVKQDSGQYPGKQGRIPLATWELKQHPAEAAVPA